MKKVVFKAKKAAKVPFFPSDHSFRGKLKAVLLILIFNSNSSVFIYLAYNGNVYF